MTNTYLQLNAELNLKDKDGKLQVHKDKQAAKQYFLEHVNQNTVFFHNLKEKLQYLVDEGYYDANVLKQYNKDFVHSLFEKMYSHKYRFDTFVGAYKFYTSYALKTFDGKRYLERFEDRVCMVALTLAQGDSWLAEHIATEIITGRFQPATPTFLNAGKVARGELVSCFLLRIEDNMESIGRAIASSLQLSKRGGGVALLLSNLREAGAPIKKIEHQSSGVVPVMKLLEDSFSYANQLGARQGAGAVYLHAHHPDIMSFLDTKRENADEKIRIKTLSLGVVIPDITFELARRNEDMYLFSPYDIQQVYGKTLSDISITDHYQEMVEDPRIRKTKINARQFFQTLAEIQFESGYPYIMFEDTVNRANPLPGRVNMSNLCSEILQTNTPTEYREDLSIRRLGEDISCNLGSLNIAKVMENPVHLGDSVKIAIRALTGTQRVSTIPAVPSIEEGNTNLRAIGLGQMGLHGFLAQNQIHYGSPEALEFVDVYFAAVRFYALYQSSVIARTYGSFKGFEKSGYADGTTLAPYTKTPHLPTSPRVRELFQNADLPTPEHWASLDKHIRKHGLHHAYLLAVPPTGNISYVNGATSSIHPVVSPIEIRKEGRMGRVYYPAPGLTEENLPYYQDAYQVGYEKIIDTYAAATPHTDQGLSLTLFFKDTATTRDINKAQIYAWRKGIKTLYYIRLRQDALQGTQVDQCISCTL